MWNILDKFFGRKPARVVSVEVHSYQSDESSFRRKPAAAASKAQPSSQANPPQPASQPRQAALVLGEDGEMIELDWSAVVAGLPGQLRSQLSRMPEPGDALRLPVDLILPQLAQGAVSIRFNELQRRAPEGSLKANDLFGDLSIPLPLKDILEAVPPDRLPRRDLQARPELPVEEVSPWPKNESTDFKWLSSPKVVRPAAPSPKEDSAEAEDPAPTPRYPASSDAGVDDPSSALVPEAVVEEPAPLIRFSMPDAPAAGPVSEPVSEEPAAPEPEVEPMVPLAQVSEENTGFTRKDEVAWKHPALPEAREDCLRFLFEELLPGADGDAAQWMQALEGCCIDLPLDDLDISIRGGRVAFQWGMMSRWIKPEGVASALGLPDDAWVELPLQIVAPAFMARRRENGQQRKPLDVTDMPDLFDTSPDPETTTPAAPSVEAAEAPLRMKQESEAVAEAPVEPPAAAAQPWAPPQSELIAPGGLGQEISYDRPEAVEGGLTDAPYHDPDAATESLDSASKVIEIEFASFLDRLPEGLRKAMGPLSQAILRMPSAETERALSAGCALFTWSQIMDWVHPATQTIYVDLEPNAIIELPLELVVPDFMNRVAAAPKDRRHVEVPSDMPDLFQPKVGGAPSGNAWRPPPEVRRYEDMFPEEAAAAAAEAAGAPAQTAGAGMDTLFGEQAGMMEWSAADVVQSCLTLPEVEGAVISTSEGFLVAGAMPSHLDREAFAALTPQIAGRASQHLAQLGMEPLKHLCLTTGDAQLHIYTAGAACLTVLGSPGGRLPVAQLSEIAEELARQHNLS